MLRVCASCGRDPRGSLKATMHPCCRARRSMRVAVVGSIRASNKRPVCRACRFGTSSISCVNTTFFLVRVGLCYQVQPLCVSPRPGSGPAQSLRGRYVLFASVLSILVCCRRASLRLPAIILAVLDLWTALLALVLWYAVSFLRFRSVTSRLQSLPLLLCHFGVSASACCAVSSYLYSAPHVGFCVPTTSIYPYSFRPNRRAFATMLPRFVLRPVSRSFTIA